MAVLRYEDVDKAHLALFEFDSINLLTAVRTKVVKFISLGGWCNYVGCGRDKEILQSLEDIDYFVGLESFALISLIPGCYQANKFPMFIATVPIALCFLTRMMNLYLKHTFVFNLQSDYRNV